MILFRLLALLAYVALAVTDPYRPFPAAVGRPPAFPRERLTRTGLDEATVDRLEDEFDALDAAGRVAFGKYVTANSDDVIRQRYASGAPADQPAGSDETATAPTYDELNALTIDQLDDRLREWNDTHPEQHLTIAGRKGEKIGRLLDAYESEQGDASTSAAPAEPVAEQQLPTATTPEDAPQDAATSPAAPAGTVDTPTGVQEPAQTADAAGAGPTT